MLLRHKGIFYFELWRNDKLIKQIQAKNGITTEGKDHVLNSVFRSATQITTWYIGLIDAAGFASLLVADTLASHTGWSEIIPGTGYTGNRQEWVKAAATGGSMTSSSQAIFPILGTYRVQGGLLCSVASGSVGTLQTTGIFDTPVDVINGDDFKVVYSASY